MNPHHRVLAAARTGVRRGRRWVVAGRGRLVRREIPLRPRHPRLRWPLESAPEIPGTALSTSSLQLERIEGGAEISRAVDLATLPLFVPAGAIGMSRERQFQIVVVCKPQDIDQTVTCNGEPLTLKFQPQQ